MRASLTATAACGFVAATLYGLAAATPLINQMKQDLRSPSTHSSLNGLDREPTRAPIFSIDAGPAGDGALKSGVSALRQAGASQDDGEAGVRLVSGTAIPQGIDASIESPSQFNPPILDEGGPAGGGYALIGAKLVTSHHGFSGDQSIGGGGGGVEDLASGGALNTLNNTSPPHPLASGESAVPEPSSWATMLIGVGILGAALRRRSAVANGWGSRFGG